MHWKTRKAGPMITVTLTESEKNRILWWLHKPVPPGPGKEMDQRLIQKLSQRGGDEK